MIILLSVFILMFADVSYSREVFFEEFEYGKDQWVNKVLIEDSKAKNFEVQDVRILSIVDGFVYFSREGKGVYRKKVGGKSAKLIIEPVELVGPFSVGSVVVGKRYPPAVYFDGKLLVVTGLQWRENVDFNKSDVYINIYKVSPGGRLTKVFVDVLSSRPNTIKFGSEGVSYYALGNTIYAVDIMRNVTKPFFVADDVCNILYFSISYDEKKIGYSCSLGGGIYDIYSYNLDDESKNLLCARCGELQHSIYGHEDPKILFVEQVKEGGSILKEFDFNYSFVKVLYRSKNHIVNPLAI